MTQPSLSPELEASVANVEQRLAALGNALRERNGAAIEEESSELHQALAGAVQRFAQAARQGGVPPVLRQRLAETSGQVAAQRESLARATAALDRAIDVLMPGISAPGIYTASGGAERNSRSGTLQA
jgi:hypothetical protein